MIRELRRLVPKLSPFGVGGDEMREAGGELLAHVRDTAVVGLTEVVSRVAFFRRLRDRVLEEVEARGAAVAVLVDFSGFNLRLAKKLHAAGRTVVWYVSPQVWAWRTYRARTLGRVAAEILVVFPFEVDFYAQMGIPVTFVGHPLVDRVRPSCTEAEFRAELGWDDGRPLIGLLPGSRRSEVARLAPVMGEAAAELARSEGASFVVAAAPRMDRELLRPLLELPRTTILEGRSRDVLAHSRVSVVASGSVTVEGALLGAPMVVTYRMAPATFAVVKRAVKVPFAAMPNLLLEEEVLPELIQSRCTPGNVCREVRRLLQDEDRRRYVIDRMGEVRQALGEGNPAARAAQRVARHLGSG